MYIRVQMANILVLLICVVCCVLCCTGVGSYGYSRYSKGQPLLPFSLTPASSTGTTSGVAAAAATPQKPTTPTYIGCFLDKPERAIPTLEGSTPDLTGNYRLRTNPIDKCRAAAQAKGYSVFAVQDAGYCSSGPNAATTYNMYGPATNCNAEGTGGGYANAVYRI